MQLRPRWSFRPDSTGSAVCCCLRSCRHWLSLLLSVRLAFPHHSSQAPSSNRIVASFEGCPEQLSVCVLGTAFAVFDRPNGCPISDDYGIGCCWFDLIQSKHLRVFVGTFDRFTVGWGEERTLTIHRPPMASCWGSRRSLRPTNSLDRASERCGRSGQDLLSIPLSFSGDCLEICLY